MSKVARTVGKDQVLLDIVCESPVDRGVHRSRRRVMFAIAFVILVIAVFLVWRFNADRPVDYSDASEHFKYGSIGSEPGGSLFDAVGGVLPPYPIFAALPQVCPDLLPGGYAEVGFLFEEGMDRPIGVSRRFRLGVDQAGLNCAVCHTGTVRESVESEPQVILGMPAHQLDLQRFFQFILQCTLDERYTVDNVLAAAERNGTELSWIDRLLLRRAVIPRTREATLQLERRISRLMGNEVTPWGRGRVDTFNPYKAINFNWKLSQLPLEQLNAASDFPSLWNQRPREGMFLHWDGNNDSIEERNLSASLGAGVTPVTIDHARLGRVRDWIADLPPPAYPFPIDGAEAARGRVLYERACVQCHADHRFKDGVVAGSRVGQVELLADIGTDPGRLDSYTYEFAVNQYTLYPDSEYRFNHFRKTQGYANHPLDGIWARAPYLHNGSVPTLRDLMNSPEERPASFFRGYDVYDPVRVGFVHDVAEEDGRRFTQFDTRLPGNGNGGHVYGVSLSDEEKDAIVEYLKTF